jgi:hypothetical protein
MPQYSYATLTDALNALGARLYDPTFQQWNTTELTGYIVESLRTWNAQSGFWRSEFDFTLAVNRWWYDLRAVSGTVIPYTVTQEQMIVQIENHLIEPPTTTYPLVWSGSNQFAISDILSALQRRQDETLGTTGCTIKQQNITAALAIRQTLTDDVIDIRRVAWLPGSQYKNKILRQSDRWTERAFKYGYTQMPPQPPSVWMQNTEPPPSFDLDIAPPVTGQFDILTVNSGPAWSATSGSLLNIPDDWTWVFKWGALFDLLSRESNSKDEPRAAYCKARYEEGLALLENSPLLLALRLDNIPMAIDSVTNGDAFNPLWQSAAAAKPKSAYVDGDLIAFAAKPDNSYTATVAVCQNAPVPVAPTDFIQVARDDFDSIIDYAQHLALFKSGGQEFSATLPLYQKFQRKAAQYNGKLKEMGFFEMPQLDISQLNEMRNARYLPGTGPDA